MGTPGGNAASELLALWERGAAAGPAERDEALLAAMNDAPPTLLGARNAALLGLRARLFGSAQQLRCTCPRCSAISEFTIDCDELSRALVSGIDATRPQLLEADGHRIEFRVPDIGDLRDAARLAVDDAGFVQVLLERCVLRCQREDGICSVPYDLPAPVTEALSRRMETLEPGAIVSFALICPECGESWGATMSVGDTLWSELQSRAERLLLDVDALARAYGWSEAQILALTPTRRAAYLQLVGAA